MLPTVDGLKCQRCRGGLIRISSRTILNQGQPSGMCVLDGTCERCGYTMRFRSEHNDIADIVHAASRIVDEMRLNSEHKLKLFNLIESISECVRANTVEGIFKSISSVIDINLVRASTDDEFGRAFEARVRVDTVALDRASLGIQVDSAPSNAIEVFQRIKKAIYDDGVIATTIDTSRDRSVHGRSLGDAPDIRRFSSDRAPNGPGLDRVTIRSDIHATGETNLRRPPRIEPQVTPMTDEDIARLTRPDRRDDPTDRSTF